MSHFAAREPAATQRCLGGTPRAGVAPLQGLGDLLARVPWACARAARSSLEVISQMPTAARPIFGPATALLVGLASQALQVRCPKVTCASRKAVSPLRGCSILARGLPKPCQMVSQRRDVR